MILNISSCLLHVYISISVTWLQLLERSWEWFNREVWMSESRQRMFHCFKYVKEWAASCRSSGLVDPGGESPQHTVYHHNAWNSVLLSVVMRAIELLHSLILPFLLCEPLLGMLRAMRGNHHTCNDSSPLVLSESAMGVMYPLTSSSCKRVLKILSISDGTCCGAERKDGGRRLYLMC